MAGRWEQIGGRRTFVPPFVNERFDGPPFWSCTFTSLLNGANIAWLGQIPASHGEVAALARASGDSDTRSGSRSRHMIEAIRVRYGRTVALEHLRPDQARDRLSNGWALVAGVTYGEMPLRHRRWSPRFKLGHRVAVFGFSNGRTRLLDPLANRGGDYGGEWIGWSDFLGAWWPDEQLWFQEGAFAPALARSTKTVVVTPGQPKQVIVTPGFAKPTENVVRTATLAPATGRRILRRFLPPRHFRVAADTVVVSYAPGNPPVVARRLRFPHASGAVFDALVAFDPSVVSPGDPGRKFLRITKGAFAGRYIEVGARGISADIRPDPGRAAPPIVVPPSTVASVADAVLEARRAEWDRIAGSAVDGKIVLPPRP